MLIFPSHGERNGWKELWFSNPRKPRRRLHHENQPGEKRVKTKRKGFSADVLLKEVVSTVCAVNKIEN